MVRTTIEVPDRVWNELKKKAIGDGVKVSKALTVVLQEYFGVKDERAS